MHLYFIFLLFQGEITQEIGITYSQCIRPSSGLEGIQEDYPI